MITTKPIEGYKTLKKVYKKCGCCYTLRTRIRYKNIKHRFEAAKQKALLNQSKNEG